MTPPIKNLKWAKYPLGDVTQWFAQNPAMYAFMGLSGHNGIDMVRPHGEHMFAVERAIVTDVKDDPSGYGRHVRIRSKDGKRRWTYGHCHEIMVKEGQEVAEGQFIATMGNTGFVVSDQTGAGFWGVNPYAGTHLHFGLRLYNGDKVLNYDNGYKGSIDPLPYFLDPKLTSTKMFRIASTKQDKTLFQFAELLQKIGL